MGVGVVQSGSQLCCHVLQQLCVVPVWAEVEMARGFRSVTVRAVTIPGRIPMRHYLMFAAETRQLLGKPLPIYMQSS